MARWSWHRMFLSGLAQAHTGPHLGNKTESAANTPAGTMSARPLLSYKKTVVCFLITSSPNDQRNRAATLRVDFRFRRICRSG
jgi:hypothetical protein